MSIGLTGSVAAAFAVGFETALALGGAAVGIASQGVVDVFRLQLSPFSDYVVSASSGAVGGALAPLGPVAAGAGAAATGNLMHQAIDAGKGQNPDLSSRVKGLALDVILGAGLGQLSKLATPQFFKKFIPTHIKGDIGEALTAFELWFAGKPFLRNVPNAIGESNYDFGLAGFRNYVESKFGTARLSTEQRAAARLLGTSLKLDEWTYEKISATLAGAAATPLVQAKEQRQKSVDRF